MMNNKKYGIIAFILSLVLIAVAIPAFANELPLLAISSGNASGDASGDASGQPASSAFGDIDGDGYVSAIDSRLALRYAVQLEIPTDAQKIAADVTGDSEIKSDDARLILRYSVKLETSFPVQNTGE